MKRKKRISYYFGNILIFVSIVLTVFIYWPVLSLRFFPPPEVPVESLQDQSFTISIPKLKLAAPVIKNVDPWNEEEYRTKLKEGVAHAKGTMLPGQKGTSYLFAHSSDLPWRMTRYNVAFYRLGELDIGDEIKINFEGDKYTYKVNDIKIVWPSEVGYLIDSTEGAGLILQTCTPVGTSLKRLLVFAEVQQN